MITGGAGSLGRRLAVELLAPKHGADAIRVLDNHENAIAHMKTRIHDSRMRYLLGDVRDHGRMMRAMENVNCAILCAATKHVDLCEFNPFESVMTNVYGTQNCIDAALQCNVERILYISSDKSVYPISTYGRCKALAESLILDARNYVGNRPCKFSIARPPNYIGSDGSVFELWNYQKKHKLPITVTDERMERYFMPFPDIIEFISKCIVMMRGGEIFVPLGAERKKIIDLARTYSDNIKIIGMRKGERLVEHLMTDEEITQAEKVDGLWIIKN